MRPGLCSLVVCWSRSVVLCLTFLLAGTGTTTAQPAVARQDVAVIFLHGRLGSPAYLAPLLQALRAEGYRAETPVMSWSRARAFDSTVEESMAEVDAIAAKLRAQGARRLVVAGHSLGGAAALRYGATRPHVDALVLVAASWNPAALGWQRVVGESVARARAAIDAGRDRATDTYQYVANDGSAATVVAVARGFYDFNRSDSPIGVPASARVSTRARPVLWLSASADSQPVRDTAAKAFAALPTISAWLDQAWR